MSTKLTNEERLKRAKKEGESSGCEVTEILDIKDYHYVIGINHNLDCNGNEFGPFKVRYGEFLRGDRGKNVVTDKQRMGTEEWVRRAKELHPEYNYDKVVYVNRHEPVIITCPIHGDFSVTAKYVLQKDYKCEKCKRDEKCKEALQRIKDKYPQYDYSKAVYTDCRIPITLICPKHGEFTIMNAQTLKGQEHLCHECNREYHGKWIRLSTEQFIEKAKAVHGDKYDYSLTEYTGSVNKVTIICPIHGPFQITAESHLEGHGCTKCTNNYRRSNEEFIEECRQVHGDKYDYSKVQFEKMDKKVCVICHEKDEFGNEHGEFWIKPSQHLKCGVGCQKCANRYMDKELFIKRARDIHGDKYDYSQVEYNGKGNKVCIICPKHGPFWQRASTHLEGKGCPKCNISHLERAIEMALQKEGIEYVYQYRNKDLFFLQTLDFYIPSKKIAIECQGSQHFIGNFFKVSKGEEYAKQHFENVQERDKRKLKICRENDIDLIYYFPSKFNKYVTDNSITHFSVIKDIIAYIQTAPDIESVNNNEVTRKEK